jgi:hypothetical protein
VRDDDEPMRAAAGGSVIVILRNQLPMASLSSALNAARSAAERKLISASTESVARRLPGRFRATDQVAHFADHPCAQGDEIIADSRSTSRFGSTATGPRAPGETT